MSNRYKKQRTLTGLPTGRRVRWMTFHGRPLEKGGEKKNHAFMIVKLNGEGKLEYVGWTGQMGICRINGKIHHYVPGNMFAHTDQNHIVIYSVFVPFGAEDECCREFVEDFNKQLDKPVLNWWAPAGTQRGTLTMAPTRNALETLLEGGAE